MATDDEVKTEGEEQEESGDGAISDNVLDAFDEEAPASETVSLDALADEEEDEFEKESSEEAGDEYPLDTGDGEEEERW